MTESEYGNLLLKAYDLMDSEAGTPEAEELARLVEVIEKYEELRWPELAEVPG